MTYTDSEIIELYWNRDESAITCTDSKYHSYLHTISFGVLKNKEDSEEMLNDTYLRTWNLIPSERPAKFLAFLSKICRNLSIDRYRANHAGKRVASEYELCIDELSESLTNGITPEGEVLSGEITNAIERFLRDLPKEKRIIFLKRYFYMDDIKSIAEKMGLTESNVKTSLHRSRENLLKILEEEQLI